MMLMKQQEDNNKTVTEKNTNLTIYIQQLHDEINYLMNRTQELTKGRDDLNWTLEFILTFDTFPVKDFCRNKRCQPCQNSWVLFQNKCYLFYKGASFKTWEASRQFCQNQSADLVVVENLQEQEFISNNTEPYLDNIHGYWLGLRQINNSWVWVDGHNDTLE
ncbi:C-type lectin domain family 4 member G-like [Nematolebias whitei]|uniref:C-type lectin domain family 4 member G-like n=1 Tax=Nematolebias whitei TaxID=451745 RepID=UPI001896BED9|nr:C-type lectin domain family 4 member G-like [Nematolebias whitei]